MHPINKDLAFIMEGIQYEALLYYSEKQGKGGALETILIVEDQPANQKLLTKLLKCRKSRVLIARDGKEALDITRREKPELVIADVLMPRMDGYEFVRRLRADPLTAETKVIYYTGNYVETESRALAEDCGVSRVVSKAADPEELLKIIDEVLETATPAAVVMRPSFEKKHLRLVTDKLSEKVNALETLNSELEQHVVARTKELGAANSRLIELNKLKDKFLAIVSHDLRTPLSGILLSAQTMAEQGEEMEAEARIGLLKQIAACAAEQITFVNDLLILARCEDGEEKRNFTNLRLSDVARDSMQTVSFTADAKSIPIEIIMDEDEPVIFGDHARLLQVFNNLLINAIKFTPKNGRVRMEISHTANAVCAKITDTGIGIPAENMMDFSKNFENLQRMGTEGETGTGLGLVIVRQVMDLHEGSIEVESAPDSGTSFIIRLPWHASCDGFTAR